MDLIQALRGTASIREFEATPVEPETLYRVLDTARFAPSGGNRQGWRVVVVRDAALRARMSELYKSGWREYVAQGAAGLVAWSPLNDPETEAAALRTPVDERDSGDFVDRLHQAPVILAVLADLGALAAADRDLDRYTFAGGASVYPFVWSVLLAAHAEGLAGVLTTMQIRRENEVRALLAAPAEMALAAVLFLGYPRRRATRLRRAAVGDFATVDRIDGPPLSSNGAG
jgi:nitroreductase